MATIAISVMLMMQGIIIEKPMNACQILDQYHGRKTKYHDR